MRKKQSLATTNTYLQDPKIRAEMILKSVSSSSKIEGVRISVENELRVVAAIKTQK